jgi:alpha-glucosidase
MCFLVNQKLISKKHMPQEHFNTPLGEMQDLRIEGQIFHFETSNAKVQLSIFADNILRVRALQINRPWEDFSYAVIAKPSVISFEWEDEETHYLLKTDKIHLEITKNPLRFRFFDTEGNLLNEDDPAFGISWMGNEVTTYKTLQSSERFVGLGAKTGGIDQRNKTFTNWNSDAFGYGYETDPLYTSVPFFMGILPEIEKSYGIFMDNTYLSRFNFGASSDRFSYFQAENGEMDYYFIHDDSPAKVLEAYTHLTGRISMPPLWSLGYQQCRYSYYPDTEVKQVAQTFRSKDIPADVLYLDIHYMERYKVFTWDKERFPDPATLSKELAEMGFHLVLILDPGVKVEEGYEAYQDGIDKDVFVKYPDGTLYQGEVWPSWSHFPDFTNPRVRDWWGEKYKALTDIGIQGFWNDMNEPAVWGKHFPDMIEFDFDGQKATHKKAHNVYGMQMARSTFENTKKLLGNQRPFVLTRAGFAGVQRYAAVWTGDNVSEDGLMLSDVRILNSMGLSGLAFSGYDVGGFVGEADASLFKRWISIGAFAPFYRGHTMINSRDTEPWSFGEEGEDIARNYIKLRYRLLPYIYSLFYEATQTGMPVQRSLVFDYAYDHQIYQGDFQNEYFFGPSVLVCAVSIQHPIQKVYLPEGEWFDLFNDQKHQGSQIAMIETPLDKLPLFIKAGQMLLMQSPINHTKEKPIDVLELHVYLGGEGSTFAYYEDDGSSYDFQKGAYYKRNICYDSANKTIHFEAKEGSFVSKFTQVKIYFHGAEDSEIKAEYGGKSLAISKEDYYFVAPISNFDPFEYNEDFSKVVQDLPSVQLDLSEGDFEVKW